MRCTNISYLCLLLLQTYNKSIQSFLTPQSNSNIPSSKRNIGIRYETILKKAVATTSTTSLDSSSLYDSPIARTATLENINEDNENEVLSPLSLTIEELGEKIGGIGRAKVSWDCYRIGVDPLQYYDKSSGADTMEEYEKIESLIPSRRRSQGLGDHALNQLKQLSGGSLLEESIATISHISTSLDGTTKLLCRLQKDGLEVETVIIPWYDRNSSTLCISSQVGCRQACTFCATGKYFKRSLTSDEILCQFFLAKKICRLAADGDLPNIDNVVFMGMGEPADNADNVVRAATLLTDPNGFQLAQSKVTISTVAPTPKAFLDLAKAPCVLAWSVHAANDTLRKTLVPTTKYSMIELRQGLIDTLLQRPKKLRTTMLEVALLHNMNDSLKNADDLADFVAAMSGSVPHMKLVVNLIPWNDIEAFKNYQKPTMEAVLAFQSRLLERGVYTFIRSTRGDDIAAACGQLARQKSTNNFSE